MELEQIEVFKPMGTGTQASSCRLGLQGVKVEVDHVAAEDEEDLWGWLPGLEVQHIFALRPATTLDARSCT